MPRPQVGVTPHSLVTRHSGTSCTSRNTLVPGLHLRWRDRHHDTHPSQHSVSEQVSKGVVSVCWVINKTKIKKLKCLQWRSDGGL
ncbi:hypothetical protein O3P69_005320 [Scylla paramamosain]|uniref:Uncharacterized protein n=1 Tax=Scylla paramamosain TaxID=85552 RepID=A0AAW0U9T7_SCYPA